MREWTAEDVTEAIERLRAKAAGYYEPRTFDPRVESQDLASAAYYHDNVGTCRSSYREDLEQAAALLESGWLP